MFQSQGIEILPQTTVWSPEMPFSFTEGVFFALWKQKNYCDLFSVLLGVTSVYYRDKEIQNQRAQR